MDSLIGSETYKWTRRKTGDCIIKKLILRVSENWTSVTSDFSSFQFVNFPLSWHAAEYSNLYGVFLAKLLQYTSKCDFLFFTSLILRIELSNHGLLKVKLFSLPNFYLRNHDFVHWHDGLTLMRPLFIYGITECRHHRMWPCQIFFLVWTKRRVRGTRESGNDNLSAGHVHWHPVFGWVRVAK